MRERSAGHWEVRAFTGNDPVTGKPTRATQTFIGTEKAAGKALSALVAEVNAGKFNRTTTTVGQLLDKWLEATEPHQRPRTVYENKRKIEARIRPKLGSIRLSKLGADRLDAAPIASGSTRGCRRPPSISTTPSCPPPPGRRSSGDGLTRRRRPGPRHPPSCARKWLCPRRTSSPSSSGRPAPSIR